MKTDIKFINDIFDAEEDKKIKISEEEKYFLDNYLEKLVMTTKELTRKQREWIDKIHGRIL